MKAGLQAVEKMAEIYKEQEESMTSTEFRELEAPLRDAIELAITDHLVDVETKYDERDKRIEELEGEKEDLESKVTGLEDELDGLKGELEDHKAKGYNG